MANRLSQAYVSSGALRIAEGVAPVPTLRRPRPGPVIEGRKVMKVHDVKSIRERFVTLTRRADGSLGTYDTGVLGIGRYFPGSSPWERHSNGDELLLVTDGRVATQRARVLSIR